MSVASEARRLLLPHSKYSKIFSITLKKKKDKQSLGLNGVYTLLHKEVTVSQTTSRLWWVNSVAHIHLWSLPPSQSVFASSVVLSVCDLAPHASPGGGLCACPSHLGSPASLPHLEPHSMFLGSFSDVLYLFGWSLRTFFSTTLPMGLPGTVLEKQVFKGRHWVPSSRLFQVMRTHTP